jgi:peptidoglycan/xylan/chitin deacetylase (PgdA/CDA1 family)
MMRTVFGWLSPGGAGGRLSVLIFHRVLPQPDPLFPGEPDASSFEAQMQWVRRWFSVLELGTAVRGLREGRLPKRALAVTFDDGYADNCTVALPILKRLSVPATFFIATGFLDGGRMWNDTVIEAVRRSPHDRLDLRAVDLPEFDLGDLPRRRQAIDQILPALKYLAPALRQERVDAIARLAGARLPDDLMLTTAQLRQIHEAGMTVGAHTVTHPILARLQEGQGRQEIAQSKATLEAKLDAPVSLFAYPNGRPDRDYSGTDVQLVRELGFTAAVTTAPGVAGSRTDPLQIPRFTPWDRSRLRYGLRLASNLRGAPQLATGT